MHTLKYVHTYIDDLLVITTDTYDDHHNKVNAVLYRLQLANLRVNVKKSSFTLYEIEYLGYFSSRDGIKSQPGKISAIFALREPQDIKQLCRFLIMVQYYRNV